MKKLGILLFVFAAISTHACAQAVTSHPDSVAMVKTIDSLRKVVVKKDKAIKLLQNRVDDLTTITLESIPVDDMVNYLYGKGYWVGDYGDFSVMLRSNFHVQH